MIRYYTIKISSFQFISVSAKLLIHNTIIILPFSVFLVNKLRSILNNDGVVIKQNGHLRQKEKCRYRGDSFNTSENKKNFKIASSVHISVWAVYKSHEEVSIPFIYVILSHMLTEQIQIAVCFIMFLCTSCKYHDNVWRVYF